jgi:hypothetical protein
MVAYTDCGTTVLVFTHPPVHLQSSIPGAWVSPLNLIRRALDMAIPHNSRQWDSYKGAALEKMIDTLWLAVTGVRGALQPESKQAGESYRAGSQKCGLGVHGHVGRGRGKPSDVPSATPLGDVMSALLILGRYW